MACETCPFAASLEAARELVEKHNRIDGSDKTALGGIALTAEALEAIASRVTCEGQIIVPTTGQVDCPIRELALATRAAGYGPWNQGNFAVSLSNVAPQTAEAEPTGPAKTGQYL